MTDRNILAFHPTMAPAQEIAAGDRGVAPHLSVPGTISQGTVLDIAYGDVGPLNDWAPTGYETSGVWRLNFSESGVFIRGMVASHNGEYRTLMNQSGDQIGFVASSGSSAEENQFVFPADRLYLDSGGVATFFYDPASGFGGGPRWQLISFMGGSFG